MYSTNKRITLLTLLFLLFSINIGLALDSSPYAGKVVINEILYKQTCGGLANATINDEFIELYFVESVNVSGWTISDGNIVNEDTDGSGGFSFKFPSNSIFSAGDYVVVWIGNSNDPYNLKNAVNAKAQFYVGKSVKLNDNGDDIWLFDAQNRLVDYMAYGSDNAINDQSYLPSGAWDGNNAPANCTNGQSLSLTPNGQDCNSGTCWEPTTSGTAPGPITRDTDDLSCGEHERISSAGINNNAEKVEINGYVYEDFYPLGVNNGEDVGIENVEVYLFKDNGDGILNGGDTLIANTCTNGSGYYNFSGYFDGIYFVVVNSKTVGTTRSLNTGYNLDDIWAEQTYQTEYSNSWKIVKKFGGQNVNVSDDFSNNVYEHWTKVNVSNYNGELINFGFSFNIIVNTKDCDEDGTTGTGRSAQGTLRQFLENARAISGPDRSYFIFNNPSNKIITNSSLYMYGGQKYNRPGHPAYVVEDSTHLNGTILDWNLNPSGDVIVVEGIGCLQDCLIFLAKGNNVTMENMIIVGNSDSVSNTGIRGIRLSNVTNGLFKNIEIYNCHIGIELYWNAQRNTLSEIESHDNIHSGIYFNWVYGSHNYYNTIKNCKAYNNKYTGIGLYYDSDDNIIENNEIYNNGWAGIWIGYLCDNNEIKNNHAYNNLVSGILISTWQGYEATNNVIANNIVENNGGFWGTIPNWTTVNYDSGIGLYNANDNTIKNNTVKNNYHPNGPVYGIALDGDSNNNEIYENQIFGNGVGINVVSSSSKNNIFSKNSIYNNYGLGIDLGNDSVTLNDGVLNSNKPNNGIDYPIITSAKLIGNQLYVEGFINSESANTGSSNFANAIVEIFLVKNSVSGDNLIGNFYNGKNYGEGWIYLGTLIADGNGNFNGYIDVSGKNIDSQSLISATTTLNGKGTSEFGPTAKAQVKVDVIKIDNPDPVKINDTLRYTINVSNKCSTSLKVVVKDVLDENVTYMSSLPSGMYNSSNHTVVWILNLNPLEFKTIKLNVSVKDIPDGTILKNHVTIYSDGDMLNDAWQNTTAIAAEIYDPKIATDLNGPPLQPGDVLEYSIWLNNTGSLNSSAKFVDPIPLHTSYANYVWSSDGRTYYNSTNNSIEWDGTIPANGKINIKFRVKIDAPLPDNTTISNQGKVYYDSNGDGIIDSQKPTDDPSTNEAYDPTNVTVKNPKISLTKTATKAEYDKNIKFTIKICVEGYATNVTLTEHYPPKFQFVDATPKPTKGNNVWYFEKLQDECVEIKVTMYIPAYYYEFEMGGYVEGKGIVLNNKRLYTGIKPVEVTNRVTLTCDQGIKNESSVKIRIGEKKGNTAKISERGIGYYSSSEKIKVKRRIIYVEKSVNATSTKTNWSVRECLKNKYGDYIVRRLYGKDIQDEMKGKSSTPRVESKTKINGSYDVRVVSDFRMNESYSGKFEINERIDGDAEIEVNGAGTGIFEEKAAYHGMFERGMGDYNSKTYFNELSFTKQTNATKWRQKVCLFNNSNYISTTIEGNFSSNTEGNPLLNYSVKSQFNGSSKFRVKIGGIRINEWHVGKFMIDKRISTHLIEEWIPDGVIDANEYDNKTVLDGFEIYWKSDDKYLYMAIKANTTGWVRIGFPMCSCFNTDYDYIVGFVVNDKTKVLDMYYNGSLFLDKEICGNFGCGKQSISKFSGKEENGYTIIEFKRKLDTKDIYDAKLIKGNEIEITWATGVDDDVWGKIAKSGIGKIVI